MSTACLGAGIQTELQMHNSTAGGTYRTLPASQRDRGKTTSAGARLDIGHLPQGDEPGPTQAARSHPVAHPAARLFNRLTADHHKAQPLPESLNRSARSGWHPGEEGEAASLTQSAFRRIFLGQRRHRRARRLGHAPPGAAPGSSG